jgi:UDP-N-acetylglucosamine 4,6-dehydratase
MTRFWITLPDAVQFVIRSFDDMSGGELYVPRIPSMRVVDLAEAVAPGAELVEIGIRPGEKLHEEMISVEDSRRTLKLEDRYLVMPTLATWGYAEPEGEAVSDGFSYTSDNNDLWLDVPQLRMMLEVLGL